jgi:ferric-dicitrate binding protein FerR (iron transport regulator)
MTDSGERPEIDEERWARAAAIRAARPQPPRRKGPRKITLALAVAGMVLAGLVGVLLGYVAHGSDPPAAISTVEQELPVVTVTVTAPR